VIVNKAELARVFGVSEPTVGRWILDGVPVEKAGSNGVGYEFDTDQVKAWLAERDEREKAEAEQREKKIRDLQAEMFGEAPLAPEGVSQADIRQYLDNLRLSDLVRAKRGELLERDDVLNDYQAAFNVVRQHALGWAATLARQAGLTPDQQHKAEQLVRLMLGAMVRQVRDPDLRPALSDAA
jgi:hypothetical protein